jgi:hypothetical protein
MTSDVNHVLSSRRASGVLRISARSTIRTLFARLLLDTREAFLALQE